MRRNITILILIGAVLMSFSCADTVSHTRGIYMLLDTSGTYKNELEKARSIIYYLLGTVESGDSLGIARIDTGSFSEKDIIKNVTFDRRPSVSNQQKRDFRDNIDRFISEVDGSPYTDITGGILQATEYLNETDAGKKYILIFSDLKEDLVKGYVRDIPLQIPDVRVVALNVTKLRSDNMDPREYMDRKEFWKKRTEAGGGTWKVVNDLERLDSILSE